MRLLPPLLVALALLLAGSGPGSAAPTATEAAEQCTEEGLLVCVEAVAVATLECGPLEDEIVSCVAETTWTIAGGSRLPVAPKVQVVRAAEAILTVCSGDLCATSHITQTDASCDTGPEPWCSVTTRLETPTGARVRPGQCADFELEAWMAGGATLWPAAVTARLTNGDLLVAVAVAPVATHQVCN